MRNAQHLLRIVLMAAVGVLVAVPVAGALMADPFGPSEIADPTWQPRPLFVDTAPVLGVDGAGNALLGTLARNAQGNEQLAVYERCGSGPATWTRTLLGTPVQNFLPVGLKVAKDGTAMGIWRATVAGVLTHYSSTRPPGGAWGEPQVITADPDVGYVQFALSDSGTAIATWVDSSPLGTWAAIRPAGGAWGTPEQVAATGNQNAVAMSATGDAVVLYQGPTPGWAFSRYRPAGGTWGGAQEVLKNNYQNTLKRLLVEFDGTGRTVAIANFREFSDTIRVNVGTSGTWGPTDQVLDDNPSHDVRILQTLVRHPQGAVAAWTRRATSSNFNDDIVVSRLSGTGWDTPQIFDVTNRFGDVNAATNDAGEILVAATLWAGSPNDLSEIRASIAPSLTAAWPAMTRVSPQPTTANQYRDALAAGGGSAFYIGWGVHGGNNSRTEMISTKPAGAACGVIAPPTPTASATAVPTVSPAPNPVPVPSPNPTPTPAPSAINDFTTLPAASKCVRNRKLTVRMKRPPKGYTVKTVTVKVNNKRVATLKAKALKKPLYLRKLPKGTFTVTITITLTKGKGLTERRRYTACR